MSFGTYISDSLSIVLYLQYKLFLFYYYPFFTWSFWWKKTSKSHIFYQNSSHRPNKQKFFVKDKTLFLLFVKFFSNEKLYVGDLYSETICIWIQGNLHTSRWWKTVGFLLHFLFIQIRLVYYMTTLIVFKTKKILLHVF